MNLLAIFRGREKVSEKIPIFPVEGRSPEYATAIARVKNLCVAAALKKMITGDYFDICTVRDMCKVTGVRIDDDVLAALQCLHCVHWNQMPRELRDSVYQILGDVFGDET